MSQENLDGLGARWVAVRVGSSLHQPTEGTQTKFLAIATPGVFGPAYFQDEPGSLRTRPAAHPTSPPSAK